MRADLANYDLRGSDNVGALVPNSPEQQTAARAYVVAHCDDAVDMPAALGLGES